MTNIIKNDPNLPLSHKLESMKISAPDAQKKAQEDARTNLIDGTPAITPWQDAPVQVGDKSANRMETATVPVKGYVKLPDMPKPANLKDIKVNM